MFIGTSIPLRAYLQQRLASRGIVEVSGYEKQAALAGGRYESIQRSVAAGFAEAGARADVYRDHADHPGGRGGRKHGGVQRAGRRAAEAAAVPARARTGRRMA